MSLLAQLNGARELVRRDPAQFPVLVGQIEPVADRPEPEIRRWCAGFLVDFLSSDDASEADKLQLAPNCLSMIGLWLEDADPLVQKYAIVALAEAYPLFFGGGPGNGVADRKQLHNRLMQLKKAALGVWGSATKRDGAQEACIKLFQVVVQFQTARPLPEYTAGLVDAMELNAEAAGFLDRLLSLFVTPPGGEFRFQQLSATVNAVLVLARLRPHLAPKILQWITRFDVSTKQIRNALVYKWISKLFQLQLGPLARNNLPLQQYLKGLVEFCNNAVLRKRAAESAGMSYADHPSKRAKKTLPPGEVHYGELYRLVDTTVATFDARDLQLPLAVNMALAGLQQVDPDLLADCLDIVRERARGATLSTDSERYRSPTAETPSSSTTAVATTAAPAATTTTTATTATTTTPASTVTVSEKIDVSPIEDQALSGIGSRVLPADFRLFVRLATRGIDPSSPASDQLKETIYLHVMADFRRRLDLMVMWLTEEWFASNVLDLLPAERYAALVARIVDQILPRLEASPADTRLFIRLLSEVPELDRNTIWKLRSILLDPERAVLGARAMKFLVMFKPPVKSDCLDLLEDVWKEEQVKSIEPILRKYRPETIAT